MYSVYDRKNQQYTNIEDFPQYFVIVGMDTPDLLYESGLEGIIIPENYNVQNMLRKVKIDPPREPEKHRKIKDWQKIQKKKQRKKEIRL